MRWLPVLGVTTALLAGCLAEPGPSVEPDPPDFCSCPGDWFYGTIEGVVMSPAVVAIAGATIAVQGTAITATADDKGKFVTADLEPGWYFLEVSAPEFRSSQIAVQVEPSVVAKAIVMLPHEAALRPYHLTQQFNGDMQTHGTSASSVLDPVLQDVGASVCDCEWDVPLDQPPAEIVIEGSWEDSVPGATGAQEYYLEFFDYNFNDCLLGTDQSTGFRYNITTACQFDKERYRVALTGPQFWLAVQQDYELFVTVFYGASAPSTWSFLEGDR